MTPGLKARYPNLKGFLFIVTYGRSGSTVLQSILQAIPGAHISGENYNALFGLQQAVTSVRRTKRMWGQKPRAQNHPWYMADCINPDKFANSVMKLFIDEVIQPPTDATWIGFKEIRYTQTDNKLEPLLDFMRNRFPNSFIVFNSRRVDDVVKSKWWARQPVDHVTALVTDMDKKFAEYAEKHPGRCFHVRHEETVLGAGNLDPIFEAIGERPAEEAIKSILSTKLNH